MIFKKTNKLHNKKSQAAMEFLITYSWVILILLISIATLTYVGISNLKSYNIDQCILENGLFCRDFSLGTDVITIFLVNTHSRDVHIINISIGPCSQNFDHYLKTQDDNLFIINNCMNISKGKNMKEDVKISYHIENNVNIIKYNEGSIMGIIN